MSFQARFWECTFSWQMIQRMGECLMTFKGYHNTHIYFSYHTEEDGWDPKLYPYQQEGANVLFFTFINPETMAVPESFKKLGKLKTDFLSS